MAMIVVKDGFLKYSFCAVHYFTISKIG